MSTASSDAGAVGGAAGEGRIPVAGPAEARGTTAADGTSASPIEALVVETGAFVDAFERWAGRKAAEAGASVPRLRLLNAVHCRGPQKMADLAEALTVTPRNVTALVDGLEAEGLVRRIPHSTDRRVTLVELTCNPDRVAAQFGAYRGSIERLFDALTAEEQGTLLRLLSKLHERIQTEPGRAPAESGALDA